MSLGKQAKILTETQQRLALTHLRTGRHSKRNVLIFLLSFDAALRAKEIAGLEWRMITDANRQIADEIRLEDKASKGRSGGVVYISKRLKAALLEYADGRVLDGPVIKSQRGGPMTAQVITNWFFSLYQELGYDGCSGHSGRRACITKWARTIGSFGGGLREVQKLARHSSLATTQKYIEISEDACRRVVG